MTIWRKRFFVYQRNACKSVIDDRGRAGLGENDLCQKRKPFAEHDLLVTLQRVGKNFPVSPLPTLSFFIHFKLFSNL